MCMEQAWGGEDKEELTQYYCLGAVSMHCVVTLLCCWLLPHRMMSSRARGRASSERDPGLCLSKIALSSMVISRIVVSSVA